jgi:acetyl-CoA carboxylase biotin carboxyl carrier protein
MEMDELKALIEFMNENGLAELEVEQEGKKIRLVKFGGGVREIAAMPAYIPAMPGMPGAPAAAPQQAVTAPPTNIAEVKAPMVGTFYRSPSPDSDPFVEVGAQINHDTTVCIIEAMKVMNEIHAEVSGKILEVLVENGQPVEYGQPLFKVELEE